QVKLRGVRIELGDIEAQLMRHPSVRQAAVIARQDSAGERRLVAYIVAGEELGNLKATLRKALRAHLLGLLPEIMIPSAFVLLDKMPVTPNGKLDRRALPDPDEFAEVHPGREYSPPQGDLEQMLAGLWSSLLHVERVGRADNFFELGGHSLLIVRMLGQLRRTGWSAEIRTVFERPTLADLALALERQPLAEIPPNRIPPGCTAITPEMLPLVAIDSTLIELIVRQIPGGAANVQDIYPLTALQEGILFHHMLGHEQGDTYVVPTLLCASSRERAHQLLVALQAVVDRHDALRTAVLWDGLPRPLQVVCRQARIPIEEVALDPLLDPSEQVAEWIKPEAQHLDLRSAPPVRARIAADPRSGEWYVLVQLHHIASDNTSQDIVVSELVAHLDGRASELPPAAPYRNHVAQALAAPEMEAAQAFFRSKLGDI